MVILLTLLLIIKVQAIDLYIDQFHGLQNRLVLSVEQPIDIQESLSMGINIIGGSSNGVNYQMKLWELTYRRYVGKLTKSGIFYSFGVRSGFSSLVSDESSKEKELAVMPFYDVGIKGQLTERWFHVFKIEAGYLIHYTKNINIDHLLGLQFTPFFSFGYNLD